MDVIPWLAVAVGGGIGSLARYLLSQRIQLLWGGFHWGTVVVNTLGCFLFGLIIGSLAEKAGVPPILRLAITTGFLGGFTTFSTFSYEAVSLFQGELFSRGLFYMGIHLVCGPLLCFLGLRLGYFLTH